MDMGSWLFHRELHTFAAFAQIPATESGEERPDI
jgi:hypothetical protein